MLAARGYAVLLASSPLPAELPRDISANLTSITLSAVDAGIAEGYIDPNRLAILGHSAGAFAVVTIVSETNRFRAAIAAAGVFNPISYYGSFADTDERLGESSALMLRQAIWAESGQAGFGAPPWIDPQRYLRNSPILRAPAISTPMLLFHATNDRNVSDQQSEEMFTALSRLGKDALFVRYDDDNHVFFHQENAKDYWTRVFSWLGEYIGQGVGRSQ
jgi:dipeptidyl aminopeptidase/acylaminoacyl peptidase